jgi:hypothetical protein
MRKELKQQRAKQAFKQQQGKDKQSAYKQEP